VGFIESVRRLFRRSDAHADDAADAQLLLQRLHALERFDTADLLVLAREIEALERTGDLSAALEFGREGLRLAVTRAHPALTAWQTSHVALLVAKCESLEAAEHFQAQAIDRLSRVPEGIERCFGADVLAWGLGAVREWAGDFAGARVAWQPAESNVSVSPYRGAAADPSGATDATFHLCMMESRLGRHDDALRLLRVLEASSGFAPGVIALVQGTLARERGELQAAEDAYAIARADFDRVTLGADDPMRVTLAHARARMFIAASRWEEAEREALDALLGRARDEGDDGEGLVQILADVTRVWLGQQQTDEAIRASARAVALATKWRTSVERFADAEVAFAEARLSSHADVARESLESADGRLARGMGPSNPRRVRIARLLARLPAS
jgi:hypothetical protein